MSAIKTEREQILNLEAVGGQHFIGEIGPHYYGVRTAKINLCLLVYNRKNWAKDDVPVCLVTNRAVEDSLPFRECRKVEALVNAVIRQHEIDSNGPPHRRVRYADIDTNDGIPELKNWLHDQHNHTRFGGATVLNANEFLQKLATVVERERERCRVKEEHERIEKTKREIAAITATAGQNLLTAYSHATRPVGAQIWDTQYYNFPE